MYPKLPNYLISVLVSVLRKPSGAKFYMANIMFYCE